MARKKKEEKKLKIIREIPSEFKVIKKEEEKEELEQELKEGLEEETEMFEAFPEISSGTAPNLQTTESLDTALANVPSIERNKTTGTAGPREEGYRTNIYDMIDYGRDYEERGIGRREMRKGGILITKEDVREVKMPRREIEEWHEIKQIEQIRRAPKHTVAETERLEIERKLPFEQRRKYREIKS